MKLTINQTQDGVVRYPMHAHKNYEIMLYLQGEGYMRTEQRDIPFARGTVVIVPPDVSHGSVSENGFRNISVEGAFDGYFLFDTVQVFSDSDSGEGALLAKLLYDNRYEADQYPESLCVAYLCFLMRRMRVEQAMHRSVREMIARISAQAFDSGIDLPAILSESGYSEDYARACFHQSTGKTPIEFLTEIRIRHACFLIDVYKSDHSLAEIAELCGYTDYVYFSKRFKSLMKMSPRSYRDQ